MRQRRACPFCLARQAAFSSRPLQGLLQRPLVSLHMISLSIADVRLDTTICSLAISKIKLHDCSPKVCSLWILASLSHYFNPLFLFISNTISQLPYFIKKKRGVLFSYKSDNVRVSFLKKSTTSQEVKRREHGQRKNLATRDHDEPLGILPLLCCLPVWLFNLFVCFSRAQVSVASLWLRS